MPCISYFHNFLVYRKFLYRYNCCELLYSSLICLVIFTLWHFKNFVYYMKRKVFSLSCSMWSMTLGQLLFDESGLGFLFPVESENFPFVCLQFQLKSSLFSKEKVLYPFINPYFRFTILAAEISYRCTKSIKVNNCLSS